MLGYAALGAGLTLQTVISSDVLKRVYLPDAVKKHNDKGTMVPHDQLKAAKDVNYNKRILIYCLRHMTVMGSETLGKNVDKSLQLIGRSFVDLKQYKAPPHYSITLLSVNQMIEG